MCPEEVIEEIGHAPGAQLRSAKREGLAHRGRMTPPVDRCYLARSMGRITKLLDLLKGVGSFFDRDPYEDDDDDDDEVGFDPDALHVFELGRAIPERAEFLEILFKRGHIRNLVPL